MNMVYGMMSNTAAPTAVAVLFIILPTLPICQSFSMGKGFRSVGGFYGGGSSGGSPWERGDNFRMTGGSFGKKDSFFGSSFGISNNPFTKNAGSFGKEGRPWEKMGGPHDMSDPPWGKGKNPWGEERAWPRSQGAWDKAYGDSKNGGYKAPWVSGKETYSGQVRSQKEQTAKTDFSPYGGYGDGSYDETEQGYDSKKQFGNNAGYGQPKHNGYGGSSFRSKEKSDFGNIYGDKGYGTGGGYGEAKQYTDPLREQYSSSGFGPKFTQFNYRDGIEDDKGFGNSAGYGKPKVNGYGGSQFKSKQLNNFGSDKFRGGSKYGSGGFGKDVLEPHDYGKDPYGDSNWRENDSKYGPEKRGYGKTPRDIHSFDHIGTASINNMRNPHYGKGNSPFGNNIYAPGGHKSNQGYFKTGGSKYKDPKGRFGDFGDGFEQSERHGVFPTSGPGYHPKSRSRLTIIIRSKDKHSQYPRDHTNFNDRGGYGDSSKGRHMGGRYGGSHGGGYGGNEGYGGQQEPTGYGNGSPWDTHDKENAENFGDFNF